MPGSDAVSGAGPFGSKGRRLSSFLALSPGMIGLLAMVILVGMGEKMAERFLPIYLMALGGGPIVVGLLNGLDNLLSALYSLGGGYLSDRLGAKRSLLLFNLLAMAGFLVVILVPAWPAVILGSFLFLSWTAISLPATMSLIKSTLPAEKRTMGTTLHSLVRRVPMALGPIVGGALIGAWGEIDGVRLAFAGAFGMAGVAMILQQRLIPAETARGAAERDGAASFSPRATWRAMGRDLRVLLVADILVRFCEQIPYAFVVVWCLKTVSAPVTAVQFGILTAVEMAVAMLIYIPVAALADRGSKKPFVVATFVNFTLFPLVLLASRSFPTLVVAFVVRGLKEFGEPTRKALILDLAPHGAEARTFGLYYLLRDVVVSVAAFGGAFLWEIDPAVNLVTAAVFGVLGTAWFAMAGKGMHSRATGS